MAEPWSPDTPAPETRITPAGWALAVVRLVLIAATIYGLLVVLALARLLETPFGRRPVSPAIVQLACRISLAVLRIRLTVEGRPMRHRGAVVANHSSWLDIFTLNAAARVYFVSKAEVGDWPLIGLVARATGTLFIQRRAADAARQKRLFEERLLQGDRLLFFPEGTSTDGRRVLRFKSTLFAAFFAPALRDRLWIQPATVVYHAPPGADPRFYGWWGEMEFAPHFLQTLAATRQGRVEVIFHAPVRVADFPDRKALAQHCERVVRDALEARLGG